MLTEGDIAALARRIASGYGALVVGTFGSYAIGTAKERSDLDVFVIKDTPEPAATRRRAVRRVLFGVMHPLDVHIFTPEEFEESAREELSFAWVIARQARLYHWDRGADARVPSLIAAAGRR